MRRPLYAANWKMHKTGAETHLFFSEFLPAVKGKDDVEIMIAPPYTALADAIDADGDGQVIIAAQNMHFEDKGAFTGEISAGMLSELGCPAVILGHSERRHVFGETDSMINSKIKAALETGLQPVFCIGEKLEQREIGNTETVLVEQLDAGLEGIGTNDLGELVVAYEPVWAIGTGHTASPEQAQEAHAFIRSVLKKKYGGGKAGEIRILYGGSVKPANITNLMAQPDVDGVLVGGASLEAGSFAAIVNHA